MKNQPALLAILLTLVASVILAGMDSLAKFLMQDFSTPQVTWARFLFHSIIVSVLFFRQGLRKIVTTRAPQTQLLRGLCMIGINTSLYLALRTISLAEATALMYLSPVLVTLLAGIFLGERILPRHMLAVALGFAGVLTITRPGFQSFEPTMLLAFLASFLLALYFLLTRKVASVDDPRTSLFYTSIVGAVVLSCLVPFWWKTPDAQQWLLLISMGALGASGHFLLIKAYTLLPASELSPWLNAQMVAATLYSLFLFHDPLGWAFFAGTGMIVGAGLLLWLMQRRAR
ncbi:MAG: DMT family transporter [Candidatus Thiothrix moscowensis]|nr:DMT family transporter [Candidatus Thiothrix moscowensis]